MIVWDWFICTLMVLAAGHSLILLAMSSLRSFVAGLDAFFRIKCRAGINTKDTCTPTPASPENSSLCQRKSKSRALDMMDVALGLFMPALDPAHPRHEFLERIKLIGSLAGVRITGQTFA